MTNKYIFDGKKFGERLKKEIKKAGYTQESFAVELDTNVTTIRSYFNGTMPKADKILNIARALNTTVEYLLTGDEVVIEDNKKITPKDIINAINTLTEAYGCKCIKQISFDEVTFNGDYPDEIKVNYNAICINDDEKIQYYLEQLRTKGYLKYELMNVDEEEAYYKMEKSWANIDDCIFANGFIYNPIKQDIRLIDGKKRVVWSNNDEDLPF